MSHSHDHATYSFYVCLAPAAALYAAVTAMLMGTSALVGAVVSAALALVVALAICACHNAVTELYTISYAGCAYSMRKTVSALISDELPHLAAGVLTCLCHPSVVPPAQSSVGLRWLLVCGVAAVEATDCWRYARWLRSADASQSHAVSLRAGALRAAGAVACIAGMAATAWLSVAPHGMLWLSTAPHGMMWLSAALTLRIAARRA